MPESLGKRCSCHAARRHARGRLTDNEPHDQRHDEPWKADDQENVAPGGELQELRCQDRSDTQSEQRNGALEHPIVHAAPLGMGSFDRHCHAGRRNRPLGNPHHCANEQQTHETRRHAT